MEALKRDGKIEIMVRVRPHAPKSRLVSVLEDGSLKLDIAAPAEEGKGNAALARFLGDLFGVGTSRVRVLSGKAARLKLVRILSCAFNA